MFHNCAFISHIPNIKKHEKLRKTHDSIKKPHNCQNFMRILNEHHNDRPIYC